MSEHRKYIICGIMLIIIGIFLGLYIQPMGMHFNDEPFQVLIASDPHSAPQSLLSNSLGYCIGNLFGWHLLSFRYFAWIATCMAIMLSGLYLVRTGVSVAKASIISGLVIIFASQTAISARMYGWDSYTILFTTLSAVIFLRWLSRPKMWLLGLCGVLSGITVTLRLPNALILPIIAMLIAFRLKGEVKAGKIFLLICFYGVSAMLTSLAIVALLFGNPMDFKDALTTSVAGEHGMAQVLTIFMATAGKTLLCLGAIILVVKILEWMLKLRVTKSVRWAMIAAVLAIVTVALSMVGTKVSLNSGIGYFVVALELWMLIEILRKSQGGRLQKIETLTIFLIGFVPAFGSLLGMTKYLVYPMLPIVVCLYIKTCRGKIANVALALTAAAVFCSGVAYNVSQTHSDKGIFAVDCELSHGFEKGILTNSDRAEMIYHLYNVFDNFSGEDFETLVFGTASNRFYYEYIAGDRNRYLLNDWSDGERFDDPEYVDYAEKRIVESNRPMKVLMVLKFGSKGKSADSTAMYQMLSKHLEERERTKFYIIFE